MFQIAAVYIQKIQDILGRNDLDALQLNEIKKCESSITNKSVHKNGYTEAGAVIASSDQTVNKQKKQS